MGHFIKCAIIVVMHLALRGMALYERNGTLIDNANITNINEKNPNLPSLQAGSLLSNMCKR